MYGDKKDYPKIDIYVGGHYLCSTTLSKTCKEAVEQFKYGEWTTKLIGPVTARKADKK